MMARLPASEVFAALIVFARVGTALAVLPGFSIAWVPIQVRLLLALAVTSIITPLLSPDMPSMPTAPLALGLLLVGEATVGFALGTIVRIVFAALQTAGTFVAFVGSFANTMTQDPVAEQQSSTISGLFSTLGVVVVFASGLDRSMLQALVDSYQLFKPGGLPSLGQFGQSIARTAADSFALGIQLSAPFLVLSLVYNVGTGLMARLMPQLPVFFFGLPLQLALQLWVMMLTISGITLIFLNRFADVLGVGLSG